MQKQVLTGFSRSFSYNASFLFLDGSGLLILILVIFMVVEDELVEVPSVIVPKSVFISNVRKKIG